MSERDLAEAIYAEIIAAHSVAEARLTWAESEDMRYTLAVVAHQAIDAVLARRQREAARTGPWQDSPLTFEERRRLFVLSGIPRRTPAEEAEYASLKARAEAEPEGPQEEPGYPGSLLPPKRGAP